VIYFFFNGCEYLQCEIHPGRPHVLTIISPDSPSYSERFTSTAHLCERWEHLTRALAQNGWTGPFGRDPRS
jgi:hypothetical protein